MICNICVWIVKQWIVIVIGGCCKVLVKSMMRLIVVGSGFIAGRSLSGRFIWWSIRLMFIGSIMGGFIIVPLRFSNLKIALIKFLSFLSIFTLCILLGSSYVEGIVSCTKVHVKHKLRLIRIFSFSCSFRTHPRT